MRKLLKSIRRALGGLDAVPGGGASVPRGAGVEPLAPPPSVTPGAGWLVVDLAARLHAVRELVHHVKLCDQCRVVTRIPPPPLGLCGVGAVLLGELCWLWRDQ
jgi:hypothetical protein